jgi:hypothetical protein
MGSPSAAASIDTLRHAACRLFGVRLLSDLHERACDLRLPVPPGRKRRSRTERIADAGLIFVHIPKAAGTSISQALYGMQVHHASIRLHRRLLGPQHGDLPSFAVLRDPVERFLSAYRYGRAGGSACHQVAQAFKAQYRAFRSIDHALDHVEQARGPYQVDHIYRPQSWYLTDEEGEIAVDRLLTMDDIPYLPDLIAGFPRHRLPCLNRSAPSDVALSAGQQHRLRKLYAQDFELWETGVLQSAARLPTGNPALSLQPTPAI